MKGAIFAYALPFCVALATSLLATFVVRALARRFGLVARPRADRWHRKPTALFGGIGIFVGFLVSYLVRRPARFDGDALLVATSAGMFLLGLVDDRVQLKPYAKLVGQIAMATLLTTFGLRLHWLPSPVLDQGLSIFWLVGVTNALNLLDNIDGAAAGIAAISAGFMMYFCTAAGRPDAGTLAAEFAGGVLGFLVFNFNPASIFMGDCGSLFIGFFLGGLSLATTEIGTRRNILATLSVPVLLLLIPIIDTTLVTVMRRYHGRPVSQGGRDHTSHRLVRLGLSERAATLVLYALALVAGLVAVAVQQTTRLLAVAFVGAFGFAMLFVMVFLGRVKVYERVDTEAAANGRLLLPTLADFSYKRRIFEVLSDLVVILLAYYGAFLLRFDGNLAPEFLVAFIQSLPVVVIAQLSTFLAMGLYKGLWRYTGMDDLELILKAVFTAVVLSTLSVLFLYRFNNHSRAVFVMDGLLLVLGIAGTRVSFRLFRNWVVRRRPPAGRRTLIYGAGDGGELLLRELQNNHALGLVPVGFVDDDPGKVGRLIHGVRVLGDYDELGRILSEREVEEVLFSTEKLPPDRRERIMAMCGELGLQCRRMRIALE